MRRKSFELENQRRTEILDACAKLYEEKGFKDMTVKDISHETSFSRPSIYNYFETKEEIFLGLLGREAEEWINSLNGLLDCEDAVPIKELTGRIADTLAERRVFLKILAMNIYEIEDNSRMERLMEYKEIFREIYGKFGEILRKFIPGITDERVGRIENVFFPFLNGIYPYAYPTEKQMEAMDRIGFSYEAQSIRNLVCSFLEEII